MKTPGDEAERLGNEILDKLQAASELSVAMSALVGVTATMLGAFKVPPSVFVERVEAWLTRQGQKRGS